MKPCPCSVPFGGLKLQLSPDNTYKSLVLSLHVAIFSCGQGPSQHGAKQVASSGDAVSGPVPPGSTKNASESPSTPQDAATPASTLSLTAYQQMDLAEHAVVDSLPQEPRQRQILCTRDAGSMDMVAGANFCKPTPPAVTSLNDLLKILGLNFASPNATGAANNGKMGNPAFAVTGHSSSLVKRHVSALNPRTIIFSPPTGKLIPQFVVATFVRGQQSVEIAARDPNEAQGMNFYIIKFKQACNSKPGGCTHEDLYSSAIEKNWVSFTVLEDDDLDNTVLDCKPCHQPAGPDAPKILRMPENTAPFNHFFSTASVGQALIADYQDAHGTEDYGGVPGQLISSSNPQLLADFILQQGTAVQPNSFVGITIQKEIVAANAAQPIDNSIPGVSATWTAMFEKAVAGLFIAVPYHDIKVTDPVKLPAMKKAYKDFVAGILAPGTLPDFREALLASRSWEMGFAPKPGLSGAQIVMNACASCHNSTLDQSISRALFNSDLTLMNRAERDIAIGRLQLSLDNAGKMPPPRFMMLSDQERNLVIQELKK